MIPPPHYSKGDEAPVPEDGIKPTFTERPNIRQLDEGHVVFECRCVGKPKPDVRWQHGDEKIASTGRYQISLEEDQKLYFIARLEINNVVIGDRGEYKVFAVNQYGETSATINLNFEAGDIPK